MKILATLHFMCFQKVLNEPQLKLKQAKDVRWLTHCNAVEALRKSYKSVVFSLSREASERSCATAAGLHTFVTKYFFIARIQMMSDILPHLNILSKLFQVITCTQLYYVIIIILIMLISSLFNGMKLQQVIFCRKSALTSQ
jgi:hypothetical protein